MSGCKTKAWTFARYCGYQNCQDIRVVHVTHYTASEQNTSHPGTDIAQYWSRILNLVNCVQTVSQYTHLQVMLSRILHTLWT